jgi:Ala-tRNA(Pro) deacylase
VRPRSVDEFLKSARVPYTTFQHPPAFTALREAAVSHVPGQTWAKTVVCIADDEIILAVLPAPLVIDFERLRTVVGARALRLASEAEFCAMYPDCQAGAMPPFGSLYRQRVFVDTRLVGEPEMVFNGGTYTDAIRMHYFDFAEIVHPVIGVFGRPVTGSTSLAHAV